MCACVCETSNISVERVTQTLSHSNTGNPKVFYSEISKVISAELNSQIHGLMKGHTHRVSAEKDTVYKCLYIYHLCV